MKMRIIPKFFKDTIAGGIFLLLPLFVIYTICKRIWTAMSGVGTKLASLLGVEEGFGGVKGAPIVSSLLILLLLFFLGLLYKISLVGSFRNWLDGILLRFIPGYDIYKANVERKIRHEEMKHDRPVVLIDFQGISEVGVIADTMPDGRKVVFVADKPGSADGRTYVVAPDRIEPLAIKEPEMNRLLLQHGNGWAALK